MKKIISLFLFLFATLGVAQTDGLSYQAVIIDPNPQELPGADLTGNILPNTPIAVRFTILDVGQAIEYQEIQNTTTDKFGMINLIVGQGQPTSATLTFTGIKWNGTRKSLQVEVDLDGTYTDLSSQVLTFLPYSFHRDITATGDVVVNGEVEFRGDLVVEGTTDLKNTLTVNNRSATNLSGTLTVN